MQKHIDKNGFVFEDLEVKLYNEPWFHLECSSPRLRKFCHESYNYYSQFPEKDNILHGEIQANTGLVEDSSKLLLDASMSSGFVYMEALCAYLSDTYFTDKVVDNGEWSINICEATMVNEEVQGYHGPGILYPHTDNPIEIIEENKRNNLDETIFTPGVVKAVLYTADDELNYDDYGTKLYTRKENPIGETTGYSMFNLEKEVKYVNGCLFMWAPGADTWHGTDYCSKLDNRRLFYTGEYYKI